MPDYLLVRPVSPVFQTMVICFRSLLCGHCKILNLKRKKFCIYLSFYFLILQFRTIIWSSKSLFEKFKFFRIFVKDFRCLEWIYLKYSITLFIQSKSGNFCNQFCGCVEEHISFVLTKDTCKNSSLSWCSIVEVSIRNTYCGTFRYSRPFRPMKSPCKFHIPIHWNIVILLTWLNFGIISYTR